LEGFGRDLVEGVYYYRWPILEELNSHDETFIAATVASKTTIQTSVRMGFRIVAIISATMDLSMTIVAIMATITVTVILGITASQIEGTIMGIQATSAKQRQAIPRLFQRHKHPQIHSLHQHRHRHRQFRPRRPQFQKANPTLTIQVKVIRVKAQARCRRFRTDLPLHSLQQHLRRPRLRPPRGWAPTQPTLFSQQSLSQPSS